MNKHCKKSSIKSKKECDAVEIMGSQTTAQAGQKRSAPTRTFYLKDEGQLAASSWPTQTFSVSIVQIHLY